MGDLFLRSLQGDGVLCLGSEREAVVKKQVLERCVVFRNLEKKSIITFQAFY